MTSQFHLDGVYIFQLHGLAGLRLLYHIRRWLPLSSVVKEEKMANTSIYCEESLAHTMWSIGTSAREISSDHVMPPKAHLATSYDSMRRLHWEGVV